MSLPEVERFLLGESGASLPVSTVLEHGLVGLAASRASGPLDVRLAAAGALVRREHERNRILARDLIAAWAELGIDTLLFKGFALAEFIYPDASWRPYSDVDAAIDERHLEAAHAAARSLGWRVLWHAGEDTDPWSHHGEEYCGHELMLLEHPSGLRLDLHRRLLHNNDNRVPRFSHQQRITRAVWETARSAEVEGVKVLLPTREDMVLVGLVLNRYWSSDRYELRATDYLDLQRLMGMATTRDGPPAADETARQRLDGLERRAAELGCSRTLRAFLRRCDPFGGRVALRELSRLEMARLDLELAAEHGHRPLARLPRDARELLSLAVGAARELPTVKRARRELTAGAGEPPADLMRPQVGLERRMTHRLWRSRRTSVRIAAKLLGGRGSEEVDENVMALALARSLRRSGIPVVLETRVNDGAADGAGALTATRSFALRLKGRRLPLTD